MCVEVSISGGLDASEEETATHCNRLHGAKTASRGMLATSVAHKGAAAASASAETASCAAGGGGARARCTSTTKEQVEEDDAGGCAAAPSGGGGEEGECAQEGCAKDGGALPPAAPTPEEEDDDVIIVERAFTSSELANIQKLVEMSKNDSPELPHEVLSRHVAVGMNMTFEVSPATHCNTLQHTATHCNTHYEHDL